MMNDWRLMTMLLGLKLYEVLPDMVLDNETGIHAEREHLLIQLGRLVSFNIMIESCSK